MIRIKMHYTQETKVYKIIDTNQKGLNQINHLKQNLPLKRKISTHIDTFDIQEQYDTKAKRARYFNMLYDITNII